MGLKDVGLNIWQKVKKLFIILFLSQLIYIILLKWINPPITITQLGSLIEGNGLKRDYIDKKQMSHYAALSVIAAEDQLFPDHNGFDIKSIKKAMQNNSKKTKRIKGASTISQQVAKNVFLWQGRSWVRKGLEAYFTFMIELIWGKERILEMYLNVVEMGKGVFGIEAAAQKFFKKPASKLTRDEAAMIAASLPNPKKYTIKPLSAYIDKHRIRVRTQMNNLEGDPDIKLLIYTKPSTNKR